VSGHDERDPHPQPEPTPERTFTERLNSLHPGLPCCDLEGACTGGARCWHDEPDNIPEDC
jgi:hypothetical protein